MKCLTAESAESAEIN